MSIEKEYQELYGDVPKDYEGRLDYLLRSVNIKKKSVYNKIKSIMSLEWKTTSFIIYLMPKATPRPRRSFSGIFYVKGAKDNKEFFQKYIAEQNFNMIYTPVIFNCVSYFPIPKSMNPVEKICAELGFIRPISKPDWDNIGKTYCDMIQDSLIYDDSLIIEGTSKKFYSVKPRIEITLKWLEDFDSEFNKKKMMRKVVNSNGK